MQIVSEDKCCGCGACENVCAHSAIEMKPDAEGFSFPWIDPNRCRKCDLCKTVCPVLNIDNNAFSSRFNKTYAGYRQDMEALKESASGGAAAAVSEMVVEWGGVVYGSEYSDDYLSVNVKCSETIEGLKGIRGTKYIQTRKGFVYREIKERLQAGSRKILYIGLPCEICALKTYLGREYDQLYTVDLICHGPTSEKVSSDFFQQYIRSRGKIVYLNLRMKDKDTGRQKMHIEFSDGAAIDQPFYNTEYGIAFTHFLRPSCYRCSFKANDRRSDITVGDHWGAEEGDECWNRYGVSAIITHTDKGEALLRELKDFALYRVTYEQIVSKNPNFYSSEAMSKDRETFSKAYRKKGLVYACKKAKNRDKLRVFRRLLGK